jgi:hypothetical protein
MNTYKRYFCEEIHMSPLLSVLGTQSDSPIADEMSQELVVAMSHSEFCGDGI